MTDDLINPIQRIWFEGSVVKILLWSVIGRA